MISLIFGLLALLLNILALVGVALPWMSTGWMTFVAFVFAIVATATGKSILKADPRDKSARAGRTIGTICIVLSVIGIILFVSLPMGCIACTMASCLT